MLWLRSRERWVSGIVAASWRQWGGEFIRGVRMSRDWEALERTKVAEVVPAGSVG